jgi:hypothetical protein
MASPERGRLITDCRETDVTTPDAKTYASLGLLSGSVGVGVVMTIRLAPAIGWFMAILAGTCLAEGTFVVIDSIVEFFTRRGAG